MGPLWGTPRGFVCRRLWETVKERCVNGTSFSTGTWKKGSFAGKSERYVKNIKDDSGNVASLTVWRFCEENLEIGLLYWGLWEICNRRLWKRSISFIGLHTGNKALSKGRFVLFFIGLLYCPLTGYSPSLSQAFLIHWGRGHLNCLNARHRRF